MTLVPSVTSQTMMGIHATDSSSYVQSVLFILKYINTFAQRKITTFINSDKI
jgi:hypothetical protein